MLTFIVLLLFIAIFVPIAKAIWFFYRQTRQMRDFMRDPQSFFNGGARRQNRQQSHAGRPARKEKKIARDEGEYIEFTEIESSATHSDKNGSTKTFTREEQVTDIEWTDL